VGCGLNIPPGCRGPPNCCRTAARGEQPARLSTATASAPKDRMMLSAIPPSFAKPSRLTYGGGSVKQQRSRSGRVRQIASS
jgi:hypothetical protein